jgi:hypothetical protein
MPFSKREPREDEREKDNSDHQASAELSYRRSRAHGFPDRRRAGLGCCLLGHLVRLRTSGVGNTWGRGWRRLRCLHVPSVGYAWAWNWWWLRFPSIGGVVLYECWLHRLAVRPSTMRTRDSLRAELTSAIGAFHQGHGSSPFMVSPAEIVSSRSRNIVRVWKQSGRGPARWCAGRPLAVLPFPASCPFRVPSLRLRPPPHRTGQADFLAKG